MLGIDQGLLLAGCEQCILLPGLAGIHLPALQNEEVGDRFRMIGVTEI